MDPHMKTIVTLAIGLEDEGFNVEFEVVFVYLFYLLTGYVVDPYVVVVECSCYEFRKGTVFYYIWGTKLNAGCLCWQGQHLFLPQLPTHHLVILEISTDEGSHELPPFLHSSGLCDPSFDGNLLAESLSGGILDPKGGHLHQRIVPKPGEIGRAHV